MEYVTHILILVGIYSILAMSLNLVVGYAGLLSVAHAAFYGVGAYSTAILMSRFNINFFLSVFAGFLFSLIFGFLVGHTLSRFRENYYVLISFGLNIIIYSLFLNWTSLTGGPFGILGISRPKFLGINFTENILFFLMVLIFSIIIYYICQSIEKSSFGRVLFAIREDEDCVSGLGYNVLNYKLIIFMISGVMASLAGSFYASYISFIDPSTFSINESIFILSIVILGGLGSNKGAIIGSLFLIILPEILRFLGLPIDIAGQIRYLVYGLSIVLVAIYFPKGLLGRFKL